MNRTVDLLLVLSVALIGLALAVRVWPGRSSEPYHVRASCKLWAVSEAVELQTVLNGVEEYYALTGECSYVDMTLDVPVQNPRVWVTVEPAGR